MDWMAFGHRIWLNNQQERLRLLSQLSLDSALLEQCNVMDYSLLVGIRRNCVSMEGNDNGGGGGGGGDSGTSCCRFFVTRCFRRRAPISSNSRRGRRSGAKKRFHEKCQGGLSSPLETSIYYLGVIDVLQKWNARKKAEMTVKRVRHFSLVVEPSFSCVDPKT